MKHAVLYQAGISDEALFSRARIPAPPPLNKAIFIVGAPWGLTVGRNPQTSLVLITAKR